MNVTESAVQEVGAEVVQFGLLVRRQQQVERGVGLGLDGDDLTLQRPDGGGLGGDGGGGVALMAVASAVSAVVIWVSSGVMAFSAAVKMVVAWVAWPVVRVSSASGS